MSHRRRSTVWAISCLSLPRSGPSALSSTSFDSLRTISITDSTGNASSNGLNRFLEVEDANRPSPLDHQLRREAMRVVPSMYLLGIRSRTSVTMISLTHAGGSQQEIGQEWLMTARPTLLASTDTSFRTGCVRCSYHKLTAVSSLSPRPLCRALNLLIRTIAPIAASGKTGNEATNWQLSPIIEDGGMHRLSL